MKFKNRTIIFITALTILPFSGYCTKDTRLPQDIPPQPGVDNVYAETNRDEIPDLIPPEILPRIIGGLSEIHKRIRYPEEAKKAGIQGRVVIQVLVDENGKPIEFKVLTSSGYGLSQAAIDAISQVRFTPAILRGAPVKFWMNIPITFKL